MSTLDQIVNLQITLTSSTPTKDGFGRPLIVAYHTRFPGRTKLYTDPSQMLTDGFAVDDQAYKLALAISQQNPRPKDFKVGRRALAPTQIVNFTPTNLTAGFVYSGSVNGKYSWTYTVPGSATLAAVCTGIAAALQTAMVSAAVGSTAVGSSGTMVVATCGIAGKILQFLGHPAELQTADVTTDPGIATDLAAIYAADSDWYGILLDSNSKAEISAAAAWVETVRRMFASVTADYACKNPASTTDVMYVNQQQKWFRTGIFFRNDVGSTFAAALMAQRFTDPPGSDTWAHKQVVGQATDTTLSDADQAAIWGKNGNTYLTVAQQGDVMWGTVCSGEFFDVVRGIDWLYAALQTSVVNAIRAQKKLSYTRGGAQAIYAAVQNVLNAATKPPNQFLSPDNPPVTLVPDVTTLDPSVRQTRVLPNVTFSAQLSGAIHATNISGTVSH
jgi:hypothetical protein